MELFHFPRQRSLEGEIVKLLLCRWVLLQNQLMINWWFVACGPVILDLWDSLMKGVMLLRESPLNSQTTTPPKKKLKKVRQTFTTTAVGRSDPPLKETASSNLQKNPSGETTNSAKSPATASLEVAVEVAGRKPQGLAPKSHVQTLEESPKYTRAPQNELKMQSSQVTRPGVPGNGIHQLSH